MYVHGYNVVVVVVDMKGVQGLRDTNTPRARARGANLMVFFLWGLSFAATRRTQSASHTGVANSSTCHEPTIVAWTSSVRAFSTVWKAAAVHNQSSTGMHSDKTVWHAYQHMYHRYLAPLALRACAGTTPKERTIRFLEIGLGCGRWLKPGGSILGWRALFLPPIRLELHIMEYDGACARRWQEEHPGLVHMHVGDQNSTADLERVYAEAGGAPFDAIVDDGSHLNAHQIGTAQHLVPRVAEAGVYFIEDIHSACKSWREPNTGAQVEGAGKDCLRTKQGHPTILAQLLHWQRMLIKSKHGRKRSPLPFQGVRHIDVWQEAAVIERSGSDPGS